MKKLFLFGFLAAGLIACKKDPPPEEPTNDFTIKANTNSLLITGYAPSNQASLTYEVARLVTEGSFGARLNHLSLVTDQNSPFYSVAADSINSNFLSAGAPSFVVDFMPVTLPELPDAIEAEMSKNPLASIDHQISRNDTAYVISSKVKFWKDTVSPGIYIQTYLLGQVRAQYFKSLNLNVPAVNDLTVEKDSASFWDNEFLNLDSSKTVIKKGDPYYHRWVVLDHAVNKSVWGDQLGTYWPFGFEFFKNDVIGTADTPILHYLPIPQKGDYDFTFSPQFITVIWILNPFSGNWEYVNSVQTNSL